jgi:hypothetical protein
VTARGPGKHPEYGLAGDDAGRLARALPARPTGAGPARTVDLIDLLRTTGTVLTYDPRAQALGVGGHDAPSVIIGRTAGNRTVERRNA